MSKKSLINTYKFLSILKINTDKNHPASQAKLRNIVGEEQASIIFGDKGTFSRRLKELADAFNTDEKGEIKQGDWEIVYPGYGKPGKKGKIYYNHPLSYFELSFLLKQIDDSVEFSEEEKESFKMRLTKATSSKFYDRNMIESQALIVDTNHKSVDDITKKIIAIRENIIRMKMIEFTVEYNETPEKIRVTPYRIIKKDSDYWLIGNRHAIPRDDVPWNRYTDDLFSYKIDLIRDIHTAHTENEAIIHWTMTKDMMPGKPFLRRGAGRETKARYNQYINNQLDALSNCNYDIKFEHNDLIKIKK